VGLEDLVDELCPGLHLSASGSQQKETLSLTHEGSGRKAAVFQVKWASAMDEFCFGCPI
jgi:hypothetical protein